MFLRIVTDDYSVRSQEIRISVLTSQGISIKITRTIWSASCRYIEHPSLKRFNFSNLGAQKLVYGSLFLLAISSPYRKDLLVPRGQGSLT